MHYRQAIKDPQTCGGMALVGGGTLGVEREKQGLGFVLEACDKFCVGMFYVFDKFIRFYAKKSIVVRISSSLSVWFS